MVNNSTIQRMFQSLRQLLQDTSLAQNLRHAQVSDPHPVLLMRWHY